MATIVDAHEGPHLEQARGLFLEYAAGLPFSLDYQGFGQELDALPGKYAPPAGRLLLATEAGRALGCVAFRPLSPPEICEMKRLYVRPEARGQRLGALLAESIIDAARAAGYRRMRLDTSRDMTAAVRLYESLGFSPIDRYNDDPVPGTVWMELAL